jgi:hypothetical protein
VRKLIVTSFVTLDGVMEAPGFEEHRDGRNAWALRLTDDEMERHNTEQIFAADATPARSRSAMAMSEGSASKSVPVRSRSPEPARSLSRGPCVTS